MSSSNPPAETFFVADYTQAATVMTAERRTVAGGRTTSVTSSVSRTGSIGAGEHSSVRNRSPKPRHDHRQQLLLPEGNAPLPRAASTSHHRDYSVDSCSRSASSTASGVTAPQGEEEPPVVVDAGAPASDEDAAASSTPTSEEPAMRSGCAPVTTGDSRIAEGAESENTNEPLEKGRPHSSQSSPQPPQSSGGMGTVTERVSPPPSRINPLSATDAEPSLPQPAALDAHPSAGGEKTTTSASAMTALFSPPSPPPARASSYQQHQDQRQHSEAAQGALASPLQRAATASNGASTPTARRPSAESGVSPNTPSSRAATPTDSRNASSAAAAEYLAAVGQRATQALIATDVTPPLRARSPMQSPSPGLQGATHPSAAAAAIRPANVITEVTEEEEAVSVADSSTGSAPGSARRITLSPPQVQLSPGLHHPASSLPQLGPAVSPALVADVETAAAPAVPAVSSESDSRVVAVPTVRSAPPPPPPPPRSMTPPTATNRSTPRGTSPARPPPPPPPAVPAIPSSQGYADANAFHVSGGAAIRTPRSPTPTSTPRHDQQRIPGAATHAGDYNRTPTPSASTQSPGASLAVPEVPLVMAPVRFEQQQQQQRDQHRVPEQDQGVIQAPTREQPEGAAQTPNFAAAAVRGSAHEVAHTRHHAAAAPPVGASSSSTGVGGDGTSASLAGGGAVIQPPPLLMALLPPAPAGRTSESLRLTSQERPPLAAGRASRNASPAPTAATTLEVFAAAPTVPRRLPTGATTADAIHVAATRRSRSRSASVASAASRPPVEDPQGGVPGSVPEGNSLVAANDGVTNAADIASPHPAAPSRTVVSEAPVSETAAAAGKQTAVAASPPPPQTLQATVSWNEDAMILPPRQSSEAPPEPSPPRRPTTGSAEISAPSSTAATHTTTTAPQLPTALDYRNFDFASSPSTPWWARRVGERDPLPSLPYSSATRGLYDTAEENTPASRDGAAAGAGAAANLAAVASAVAAAVVAGGGVGDSSSGFYYPDRHQHMLIPFSPDSNAVENRRHALRPLRSPSVDEAQASSFSSGAVAAPNLVAAVGGGMMPHGHFADNNNNNAPLVAGFATDDHVVPRIDDGNAAGDRKGGGGGRFGRIAIMAPLEDRLADATAAHARRMALEGLDGDAPPTLLDQNLDDQASAVGAATPPTAAGARHGDAEAGVRHGGNRTPALAAPSPAGPTLRAETIERGESWRPTSPSVGASTPAAASGTRGGSAMFATPGGGTPPPPPPVPPGGPGGGPARQPQVQRARTPNASITKGMTRRDVTGVVSANSTLPPMPAATVMRPTRQRPSSPPRSRDDTEAAAAAASVTRRSSAASWVVPSPAPLVRVTGRDSRPNVTGPYPSTTSSRRGSSRTDELFAGPLLPGRSQTPIAKPIPESEPLPCSPLPLARGTAAALTHRSRSQSQERQQQPQGNGGGFSSSRDTSRVSSRPFESSATHLGGGRVDDAGNAAAQTPSRVLDADGVFGSAAAATPKPWQHVAPRGPNVAVGVIEAPVGEPKPLTRRRADAEAVTTLSSTAVPPAADQPTFPPLATTTDSVKVGVVEPPAAPSAPAAGPNDLAALLDERRAAADARVALLAAAERDAERDRQLQASHERLRVQMLDAEAHGTPLPLTPPTPLAAGGGHAIVAPVTSPNSTSVASSTGRIRLPPPRARTPTVTSVDGSIGRRPPPPSRGPPRSVTPSASRSHLVDSLQRPDRRSETATLREMPGGLVVLDAHDDTHSQEAPLPHETLVDSGASPSGSRAATEPPLLVLPYASAAPAASPTASSRPRVQRLPPPPSSLRVRGSTVDAALTLGSMTSPSGQSAVAVVARPAGDHTPSQTPVVGNAEAGVSPIWPAGLEPAVGEAPAPSESPRHEAVQRQRPPPPASAQRPSPRQGALGSSVSSPAGSQSALKSTDGRGSRSPPTTRVVKKILLVRSHSPAASTEQARSPSSSPRDLAATASPPHAAHHQPPDGGTEWDACHLLSLAEVLNRSALVAKERHARSQVLSRLMGGRGRVFVAQDGNFYLTDLVEGEADVSAASGSRSREVPESDMKETLPDGGATTAPLPGAREHVMSSDHTQWSSATPQQRNLPAAVEVLSAAPSPAGGPSRASPALRPGARFTPSELRPTAGAAPAVRTSSNRAAAILDERDVSPDIDESALVVTPSPARAAATVPSPSPTRAAARGGVVAEPVTPSPSQPPRRSSYEEYEAERYLQQQQREEEAQQRQRAASTASRASQRAPYVATAWPPHLDYSSSEAPFPERRVGSVSPSTHNGESGRPSRAMSQVPPPTPPPPRDVVVPKAHDGGISPRTFPIVGGGGSRPGTKEMASPSQRTISPRRRTNWAAEGPAWLWEFAVEEDAARRRIELSAAAALRTATRVADLMQAEGLERDGIREAQHLHLEVMLARHALTLAALDQQQHFLQSPLLLETSAAARRLSRLAGSAATPPLPLSPEREQRQPRTTDSGRSLPSPRRSGLVVGDVLHTPSGAPPASPPLMANHATMSSPLALARDGTRIGLTSPLSGGSAARGDTYGNEASPLLAPAAFASPQSIHDAAASGQSTSSALVVASAISARRGQRQSQAAVDAVSAPTTPDGGAGDATAVNSPPLSSHSNKALAIVPLGYGGGSLSPVSVGGHHDTDAGSPRRPASGKARPGARTALQLLTAMLGAQWRRGRTQMCEDELLERAVIDDAYFALTLLHRTAQAYWHLLRSTVETEFAAADAAFRASMADSAASPPSANGPMSAGDESYPPPPLHFFGRRGDDEAMGAASLSTPPAPSEAASSALDADDDWAHHQRRYDDTTRAAATPASPPPRARSPGTSRIPVPIPLGYARATTTGTTTGTGADDGFSHYRAPDAVRVDGRMAPVETQTPRVAAAGEGAGRRMITPPASRRRPLGRTGSGGDVSTSSFAASRGASALETGADSQLGMRPRYTTPPASARRPPATQPAHVGVAAAADTGPTRPALHRATTPRVAGGASGLPSSLERRGTAAPGPDAPLRPLLPQPQLRFRFGLILADGVSTWVQGRSSHGLSRGFQPYGCVRVVAASAAAADAGLAAGDLIVRVNGERVVSKADVERIFAAAAATGGGEGPHRHLQGRRAVSPPFLQAGSTGAATSHHVSVLIAGISSGSGGGVDAHGVVGAHGARRVGSVPRASSTSKAEVTHETDSGHEYVFRFEFLRPEGSNPTQVVCVDVVPEVFAMVPN